jgi:hypothetical protein
VADGYELRNSRPGLLVEQGKWIGSVGGWSPFAVDLEGYLLPEGLALLGALRDGQMSDSTDGLFTDGRGRHDFSPRSSVNAFLEESLA